jgi:hypothetical protein
VSVIMMAEKIADGFVPEYWSLMEERLTMWPLILDTGERASGDQ